MASSWNDFRRDQQMKRLEEERGKGNREPQRQREGRSARGGRAVSEERPPASPRTLRRRRRFAMRVALVLVILAIAGAAVYFYTFRRTYRDYRIIKSSEREDTISTRYVPMAGKILRYSQDTVSLVNKSLETQWSATYGMDMTNPVAGVRGKHAVIADKDGTSLVMVGEDGMTGSVSTSYSIIKACVSKNGLVAAILDGGGDTWINFYGADGSLIAENQTTLEDPGYPLDVALSDNGVIMMVAYQFIDGSDTTSYVAFYNFGDVGQNTDDRIVSGFTYEGHVVPQIQYLDGSRSVAFCDNGFVTYSGSQIPDQNRTVTTQKEIVSTFFDDDTIGMVFKNDDKEKAYTMEVYSASGQLRFTKDFNIDYTTIKMSDGYVLMYSRDQLCVVNGKGEQRYLGVIDGAISEVAKIGINKYLLVLDTGVNIMKLN